MAASKRKRVVLTIDDKLKALEELKIRSQSDVAEIYGIGSTTLKKIEEV